MAKEECDILIVGGGISGLYLLYNLVKSVAKEGDRIHLYEKSTYLGGRIRTFYENGNKMEAGAARFCAKRHKKMYQLIRELKLTKYLSPGYAHIQFIPTSRKYSVDPVYIALAKQSPYDFINRVLRDVAKKRISVEDQQKDVFIDFMKQWDLLRDEEAQYLLDAFGYSGEITSMNAFNALHMFRNDLNKNYTYYSLSCGLSTLIDRMIREIRKIAKKKKIHIEIHTQCEVRNVRRSHGHDGHYQYTINDADMKYAKYVVFAIQKAALLQQPILRPIYRELRAVQSKSLCRIYMIFRDPSWFRDLSKITTDSHNRYLIPLDKERGTIMISYTDGKYADHLYKYYMKYGEEMLNTYILSSWAKTLHIDGGIERPLKTRVCYWKEGIAMWKAGVNSSHISAIVRRPMKNMFIIGENYSSNQAWIEGALETVDNILPYFKQK